MQAVEYRPPKGTPPFVLEVNGKRTVFQPPDAVWKEVEETYKVGVIIDPATKEAKLVPKTDELGNFVYEEDKHGNEKVVMIPEAKYAKRLRWVQDYKAKKGEIDNVQFIDDDAAEYLKRPKFQRYHKYLNFLTDEAKSNAKELDKLRAEHRKRMREINRAHELEIQGAQERFQELQGEVDSEVANFAEKLASEHGVTVQQLLAAAAKLKPSE